MTWYIVDNAFAALVEHIEAILSGLTTWWRWEVGRKFRLKLHEPQSHFAKSLLTKLSWPYHIPLFLTSRPSTMTRRDKPQKFHYPSRILSHQPRHCWHLQIPSLKLQYLHYGYTTSSKADPRRINQHPPKHPLLSRINEETEAGSIILTRSAVQELSEWTEGESGLKPALSFRIWGSGKDDAGHGGLEEE
jgi:hypothetical protein